MPVEKSSIVLKALLYGMELEAVFPGYTICFDKDYQLCTKAIKYNSDTPEIQTPILLALDMDLKHFINMCNKLTSDQVALIAANLALTQIHHKKY